MHVAVLLRWWRASSREEKVEWFRRNRSQNEIGKRKEFDNSMLKQTEVNIAHSTDDTLWRYLPCDEWVLRERALGRLTPAADGPEAFKAALKKRGCAKRKLAGQWCIKVFGGGEIRGGERRELHNELTRQTNIGSRLDHEAAKDTLADAESASRRWP